MLTLHSGSARAFESITCARKLSDSFAAGAVQPEEVLLAGDPVDNFVRAQLQTKTVTRTNPNTGVGLDDYVFYFDEKFTDPILLTQWFTLDAGSPTVSVFVAGSQQDLTLEALEALAAANPNEWSVVDDAVSADGLVYIDDTGVVQGVAYNDNGGSPISDSCMVSFPITTV
jgi:hypothetical protein